MTECNRTSLGFSSLFRRKISADFDGGRLTSDAGGLLLREVDRRIGLTAALADCIVDPRDPEKIVHDVQVMLAQRICGVALGYEDLNDHDTLRTDPVMQVLAERSPEPDTPLASPATLCRFENRITRRCLARMSGVFVDQFIASFRRPPKELILDFDATDDRVHGDQEGKFYHGYYDHYCYLPLYVFCGERLLCAYLRPATSTRRCTAAQSCACWSIVCAPSGRRSKSPSAPTRASVAGSCSNTATNTTSAMSSGLLATTYSNTRRFYIPCSPVRAM